MGFKKVNSAYYNIDAVLKAFQVESKYQLDFVNGVRIEINSTDYNSLKSILKKISNQYVNESKIMKTFINEGEYFIEFVNGVQMKISESEYNALIAEGGGGEAGQSRIEIICSGDGGDSDSFFTDEQMAQILDDTLNVVIVNDGEVFYLSEKKSNTVYRAFFNTNQVTDEEISYKVIFVNVNSGGITYGKWNKEIVIPESISGSRDFSTLEGNVITTEDGIEATYANNGTILFPIKGSDDIVVDVAEDGQSAIIKLDEDIEAGISKAVEITDVPPTATSGTLTEAQLATLQGNDTNYIMFNHEKYYTMDKGHSEGFIGYSHIGVENSVFMLKNITVTISTRGWSLTTKEIQ